jgi:hypothetical protein
VEYETVDEDSNQVVPVTLSDGTVIQIEARDFGNAGKVGAFDTKEFKDLTASIEAIAIAFRQTLENIRPQKASVEFGVEVGIEAGKLTALICRGSGKANVKIALEWSNSAS